MALRRRLSRQQRQLRFRARPRRRASAARGRRCASPRLAAFAARRTLVTVPACAVRDEQQGADVLAFRPAAGCPAPCAGAGRAVRSSGAGPATRSSTPSAARSFVTEAVKWPTAVRPPVTDATLTAGGKLQLGAQRQLALRISRRVPPQQRAHGGGVVRGDDHDPALRGRPHEGSGIEPAPHGVLPRPEVFAAQQRIAVEQQGRRVSAGATGSAPTVATTSAPGVRHAWL